MFSQDFSLVCAEKLLGLAGSMQLLVAAVNKLYMAYDFIDVRFGETDYMRLKKKIRLFYCLHITKLIDLVCKYHILTYLIR